ncbi:MAG: L-seryl-tRNA(Sec) selenium transferase, partial [Phycisphaerae bacterium]
RSGVIDRLRGHPMARAVRVDKLTLAALEATLELYATPGRAAGEIPALARLLEGVESLAGRAEQLCAALRGACPGESFDVAEEVSEAGGGALPGWSLPTRVVRWRPRQVAVAAMADRLRRGAVPVVARVRDDALLFDVRTLGADELSPLASAVRAAAPGAVA